MFCCHYNKGADEGCRICSVYLDDVHRLLRVLLKQQHGGSVGVYVELSHELRVVCVTLVHKAEPNIVSEGECC